MPGVFFDMMSQTQEEPDINKAYENYHKQRTKFLSEYGGK